ncbi:hypothetical protein [Luteibacter sp. RCC_6_2]|uniref:hypothetical protein n=1 Tax=Luteibacter sp. RCC_6_2 TaxID=3239223 RepID=UPI003525871C
MGGDSGPTAALNGTKYNYLTHAQIDDLNNALAACTTDSCRSDAIAEAKKQSVQNDVALAIVCNAGGSSACYKGFGALESYTDSPVVPREMRGDQTTDHHLEQSGYFGNIGFLGGVAASVYASLPQDGETGAYLSGAGAKYGNSLLPFVGNDEGPNPTNPFIPKQFGGASPQYTDGMSAAAAPGTWVGDLLGKTTWLLAGNEGKVPATTTVVEAEAGSWPNVPTLGSSPQSGANPLAVYGQNTSKMVHLFENSAPQFGANRCKIWKSRAGS